MENPVSRRKFFKVGLGTVGALAASRSVAQICESIGTAEQDLGPFFPRPGTPEDPLREDHDPRTPIYLASDNDLTFVKGRSGKAKGQIVYVQGQVKDMSCQPIAGATLIIWQASESGRYNHTGDGDNVDFKHPLTGEIIQRTLDPSFQYWGRATTDENGNYEFKTIVPGFYPANLSMAWYRPPHIHFMVAATGYPQFVTQMYFSGTKIKDNDWIQELNARDLILHSPELSEQQRRNLIVNFNDDQSGKLSDGLVGRFDIELKR